MFQTISLFILIKKIVNRWKFQKKFHFDVAQEKVKQQRVWIKVEFWLTKVRRDERRKNENLCPSVGSSEWLKIFWWIMIGRRRRRRREMDEDGLWSKKWDESFTLNSC